MVSITRASRIMGVSSRTLRRYTERGWLPAVRRGGGCGGDRGGVVGTTPWGTAMPIVTVGGSNGIGPLGAVVRSRRP